MSNEAPGMSAAGWFPDQLHPGMERYFNGEEWTAHVRAADPSQQPAVWVQPQASGSIQQASVTVPITPGGDHALTTAPIQPAFGSPLHGAPGGISPKSFLTTWVLSLFLGVLGADRIYLGKTVSGILKLVTFGGLGVWWFVDLVIALTGNATDSQRMKVRGADKQPAVAWAATGALILLGLAVGATFPKSAPQRGALVAESAANSSTAPTRDGSTQANPAPPTSAGEPSQTPTAQGPSAGSGGPGNGGGTRNGGGTGSGGGTQDNGGTGNSGATVSQQQAVARARSYLNVQAFSRSGLIDQLEFEGFSTADATYGVDQLGVDWKEQAVRKAREYLDVLAFSRSGLISQLEFEGFSTAEATYGVDQLGVDWKGQAVSKAREYLDVQAFSRSGLIGQLQFEGFSTAEATYGVDQLGVDWKEQAARKAQDYLDIQPFSHAELVSQLEFEGFTHAEAEYGVASVGL